MNLRFVSKNKYKTEEIKKLLVVPENILPQEDIKKVERKLNSEIKKTLTSKDKLVISNYKDKKYDHL